MRGETIWSLIRRVAAFVNVTVHTFTLALPAEHRPAGAWSPQPRARMQVSLC
jgi:hypothetical protein